MKSIFHNLLKKPLQRWWVFLIFGCIFILFFHTVAFFYHQFLVYRYDRLFSEATELGTLVDVPREFREVQVLASKRGWFTRPDVLARETGMIQSGIRSLVHQYRSDMYRMHDTIAQHIAFLRIVVDESETMYFPQRSEILRKADLIETELNSGRFSRPNDLQKLLEISTKNTENVRNLFEKKQKILVLQDILSFKHEMRLLDSLYRVTPELKTDVVIKTFWKQFAFEFSRSTLTELSAEELRNTFQNMRTDLAEFRTRGHEYRAKARADRVDLVASEAKKWIEKTPPSAPFSDVYSQIFVSLKNQSMYVYEDGELILSTPITSGKKNYETIRGTFKIYTKQRNKLMKSPFPDEDYELWVDYWLGFHGAYGLHDACNSKDCWRTRFGGANYTYNGSHGCVNTPYNAIKFIYNWSEIGTTVHVE